MFFEVATFSPNPIVFAELGFKFFLQLDRYVSSLKNIVLIFPRFD
jgi:hypothetical protein